MIRLCILALMALGLSDCNDDHGSKPPPAPPGGTSPPSIVTMNAAAWNIQYSPGMPAHPAAAGAGWSFDFPGCGGTNACSVNYVTSAVRMAASASVTANVQVTTTGTSVFNYKLKSDNNCDYPAHARLFLQQAGDDLSAQKEFYRWWSVDPASFQLMAGSAELTAPVSPDRWLSVLGKRGDSSSTATAGFWQAMRNLGNVGLTFGGGCFYGHGVNVTGGGARFILDGYSVK